MRELVILAAVVSALHAASLPQADSGVEYKCREDQDNNATLAAERFINEHHHHGYKFKFVSQDSRSAEEKADPCEVVLGITLEETKCHIVNPKPLDQCDVRLEAETKVTAKCNVTVSSVEGRAVVKRYICDTEPASHEDLVKKCPDCPSLLPLHEPKALESVKASLIKFNKESNHKSHFKLMEVGRISTQWMPMGQSYFAQFAIMETDCPNKEAQKNPEACKALCGDQARYGFCESSKVGSEEPTVECEIFKDQNFTHPMQHPAQSRRDCKVHGPPHHHPGHHPGHVHPLRPDHSHGDKDKKHDHSGRPEHAHGDKDKKPDHSGRPEHARGDKDKKPDHSGRPEHAHGDKDKKLDHGGRPEHAGHGHKDKKHDHRGHSEHPHHCPKGSSEGPESAPEGRHEFPCHGYVKIPPSIYPICPFPPPRLCRGPPDLLRPPPPPAK